MAALPEQWKEDIAKAVQRIQEELQRSVLEIREGHLVARLIGLGLVLVGIVFATLGNLVPD